MEDIKLCLNCDKKVIAEAFFKKAGMNRKFKLVRDKFPDLVKEAGEKSIGKYKLEPQTRRQTAGHQLQIPAQQDKRI